MKTLKKLRIGLALILVAAFGIFFTDKALAAQVNQDSFKNATYEVTATYSHGGSYYPSEIYVLIPNIVTDPTKAPDFRDRGTNDGKYNLKFYGKNYFICTMDQGGKLGIEVGPGSLKGLANSSGVQWTAKLNLDYAADSSSDCGKSGLQLRDVPITLEYKGTLLCNDASAPDNNGLCANGTPAIPISSVVTGTTPSCSNGYQNPPTCDRCLDGSMGPAALPCGSSLSTAAGGSITTAAGGSTTPTAQGTDEACYKSTWGLTWIACPVITAAQTSANAMYGFVEDQLKFQVPHDLGGEAGSVHNTWNNFRVLVSGLVVILMLVMVISQAIGSGPFDAYTVKKMLPRLVIGVILIQISWPLASWVINTVDDIGRGLADIMYAPFGGTDALSLSKILGQFGPGAEIFSWVGIPALLIFGVVAPFIVLGLILSVLVAIFMGFLALLFRKILIILCLIFIPLALISWMMPSEGLRKYWKLWQDNFIKALFMYPLIVAIIAGGRIFAKIGSGQSDFVGFFIVLIGFFGPLFILPKTFKWGGSLMQSAGSAINSATQKGLKKPLEGIRGLNQRYQGRYADKLEYNRKGTRATLARGLRRVQSGHMIPSKRSRALALQTGSKWATEERELATIFADNVYKKANTEGYTDENGKTYGPGVEAAKVATAELTRHKDSRIGEEAVKKLVATSSWPEIQSYEDRNGRKVFEDNANWTNAAAKDPETYKAVLRSRTDAAAHIIQGAEAAVKGRTFASPRTRLDVMSAIRIDTSINKQMGNEDFSAESDGFWAEAARVATLRDASGRYTAEALTVQQHLVERFEKIHAIGGTAPQQLLGHLMNGGELQKNVETILNAKGRDLISFIR